MKAQLLGYHVDAVSAEAIVKKLGQSIDAGAARKVVACLNPHSIVVAESDREFARALRNADVLLPDGVGIVIAGKLLGRDIPEKIAGYELFTGLSQNLQPRGGRYFFLGSTERTLSMIREKMRTDYPGIEVVGTYSPPFKSSFDDADNRKMIDAVNQARPDVLWVGMTAPKQEKWIEQNKHLLNARVIGAIGAVFDFYAGTKKRAPKWAIDLGLEWLPRLLREPLRLFKRNFVSTPVFLFLVVKEKLGLTRRNQQAD